MEPPRRPWLSRAVERARAPSTRAIGFRAPQAAPPERRRSTGAPAPRIGIERRPDAALDAGAGEHRRARPRWSLHDRLRRRRGRRRHPHRRRRYADRARRDAARRLAVAGARARRRAGGRHAARQEPGPASSSRRRAPTGRSSRGAPRRSPSSRSASRRRRTTRRLLVTSGWGRKLTALDAATSGRRLRRRARARAARRPRRRRRRARVRRARRRRARCRRSTSSARSTTVRAIDLGAGTAGRRAAATRLREGCQGSRSLAQGRPTRSARRPGPAIFAPMVTVDPGEPKTRSSGYGRLRRDGGRRRSRRRSSASSTRRRSARSPDGSSRRILSKHVARVPPAARRRRSRRRALAVRDAASASTRSSSSTPAALDPARLERRRWRVPAGPTGVAVDDAHGARRRLVAVRRASSSVDRPRAPRRDAGRAARRGPRRSAPPADARRARARPRRSSTRPTTRASRATAAPARAATPTAARTRSPGRRPTARARRSCSPGALAATAPYGWIGATTTLQTTSTHDLPAPRRHAGSRRRDRRARRAGRVRRRDARRRRSKARPRPATSAELAARGTRALLRPSARAARRCHVGGGGTDTVDARRRQRRRSPTPSRDVRHAVAPLRRRHGAVLPRRPLRDARGRCSTASDAQDGPHDAPLAARRRRARRRTWRRCDATLSVSAPSARPVCSPGSSHAAAPPRRAGQRAAPGWIRAAGTAMASSATTSDSGAAGLCATSRLGRGLDSVRHRHPRRPPSSG